MPEPNADTKTLDEAARVPVEHNITYGIGAEYVTKEPMMPEVRRTVAVKAECSCGWHHTGTQREAEDAAEAHLENP